MQCLQQDAQSKEPLRRAADTPCRNPFRNEAARETDMVKTQRTGKTILWQALAQY